MISIIIPALNEEKYILSTINSIKEQSFKDYETIVVCDGCTDNTPKIVKNKVDKLIILKKRKGQAYARNCGAKKSKGEILVFLDADTSLTKDVLKEINNTKESWIVGTCNFKPDSQKLKHRLVYKLKNKILCPFGVSNGIIFCKKDDFKSINGFSKSLQKGEDGKLVRTLKNKGKFKILKTIVISSTRRFDKKGYIWVWTYWLREAFKPSKGMYDVIR